MKTALVLGLGESGLAMARWLARDGWQLRIADTRPQPPMLAALKEALPQAQFAAGPFEPALLEGVELVAISPGLSPLHAPARPLVEAAAAAGLAPVGEIELFARALARLRGERDYAPRVLGVTGTNGKTTTVRMAGRMIERWGRRVAVAGNVSPSALDALREALDRAELPEVWVLELSSFQLATTASLACDAAAVLNISEDHLDWHETADAYRKAKARILSPSAVAVLNRDDPATLSLARPRAAIVSFGSDAPAQPAQYGLVREGGLIWLACTEDAAEPGRRRKAASELAAVPAPVFVHRLMPVDALQVRGRHNAMNALAALALVQAIGCPIAAALHALREYRGEPHRTEWVASLAGVDYIDDSKGTNVGATIAALAGLGADGRRLVVILGGDGKGQRFEPLAPAVRAHARAVVLIGRDGPLVGAALDAVDVPKVACDSLPAAVQAAARLAQTGDAVLLSPACASFDWFRDYAHRAEVFVAAVRALAAAVPQGGAGSEGAC